MIQVRGTASGGIEVLLSGRIDHEDMDELAARLGEALGRAHGTIVLDFQDLQSLASAAIGKLLHFKARCDQKGIRLSIRHCNAEMRQLLSMIRFDTLIQIED